MTPHSQSRCNFKLLQTLLCAILVRSNLGLLNSPCLQSSSIGGGDYYYYISLRREDHEAHGSLSPTMRDKEILELMIRPSEDSRDTVCKLNHLQDFPSLVHRSLGHRSQRHAPRMN